MSVITCGIESHEGMVKRHTGGCLCGRVRFAGSTPVSNLCHCNSCRRAAGAPLVAWGTFVSAAFHITRGELTEYRSYPLVLRGFCAACGGALTYRHEARAGEIDVTLASLDEAASLSRRRCTCGWVRSCPGWWPPTACPNSSPRPPDREAFNVPLPARTAIRAPFG